MPDAPADPVPVTPASRGRKIVIFADGTGNSFAMQESNVWRLYSALDKTEKSGRTPVELQLARYIPGVGTSSNRVLRLIDGATGIGVPSNVRKLYRFLCWNWQPGDEVYLFGFSRGAFTVRTLAGMIRWQGLMPLMIGERPVTDAEMKRNAMRAWEAYRAKTAPLVQDGRLKDIRLKIVTATQKVFLIIFLIIFQVLNGINCHKMHYLVSGSLLTGKILCIYLPDKV